MRSIQALSRRSKLALTFAALALLVGSGMAYADKSQAVTTSNYEFQILDPGSANIVTWVNGSFVGQPAEIYVNMSSYDGVAHLNGTFSVIVQIWNDSAGAYVYYQTLASNETVSLTPTPVTLHYTFTTDIPGSYNVFVEFDATEFTFR
jgi:hypothetical protein